MAVVGRIARAHGNRGHVIVDPATDFPEERFKPGSVLQIRAARGAPSVSSRERPVPSRAADYRARGHRHDERRRGVGRQELRIEHERAATAAAARITITI
jgi:ribosomal 30S subunit maturation factor RimM